MRTKFAFIVTVVYLAYCQAGVSIAISQESLNSTAPKKVDSAELYKPTLMPDRIILTWAGDPRTTQSVTWRTSSAVEHARAQLALADASPYLSKSSKELDAKSQTLQTDLNAARFHTVSFTELTPGTKYAYRVGDGVNWSEWFQFRTASARQEPFSFIYFGDAQNDIRSMWSRVIREAYSDAPKAAFLLHAGDLINVAERDAEWGEWFGAGGWLNAMTPNVAVPGNHEQAKSSKGSSRLSHHWRPQFEFPCNGPVGLEESCFTINYSNMLLVCLNSNEQLELQAQWLDEVLSKNSAPWVVCCFHHPVFSTAQDRDNAKLRGLWKPILDKYRVDLVLQGHDHTYGRTGISVPVQLAQTSDRPASAVSEIGSQNDSTSSNVATGAQNYDQAVGTVYVVSVSGPKMYNIQRRPFMKRIAEDTQLYQIIQIDGGKLFFEARTANGSIYDSFELRKRSGQPNELIEISPEVPEATRSKKE